MSTKITALKDKIRVGDKINGSLVTYVDAEGFYIESGDWNGWYKEPDASFDYYSTTPTLENLREHDVITNNNNTYKILVVINEAVLMSMSDNHTSAKDVWFTKAELIRLGYKVKTELSDTVEIIVEGKKKNISRQSAKELNLL